MPIQQIYFAAGLREKRGDDAAFAAARQLTGSEARALSCGDKIDLGRELSLTMLWPERAVSEGGNNESICMRLDYDYNHDEVPDSSVLLTGDLERSELAPLVSKMEDPQIDVLKVGHHGSRVALSRALVERMQCTVALIGVGKDNYYGHPASETLEALEEVGAITLRTDLNGNITLYFRENELVVRCDTISNELVRS
jgi:competence protein ComEC